jgi:hypothetical protein
MYWPVIGAVAGLCAISAILLVLVLRQSGRPSPPSGAAPAPTAQDESPGLRVAEVVATPRDPSPADVRAGAEEKPAPAAPPAPPAANPPADDETAVAPPPGTGLPDLLVPPGAKCGAPAACGTAGPERYGTAVDFVSDPTEAARQALRDKKLLFVLHVAGNFEDSKFT